MARAALMSPSLFSRRFREAYGDTPYGYLQARRVERAIRQAMREIVAKGDLAVFIQVDDLDKTFESLRAAGAEILQEPVDQPYGVRDAAVRDPSDNHLRLSQPLVAQG
jgi:predicted enzyme related to lactoylglutathione lyase